MPERTYLAALMSVDNDLDVLSLAKEFGPSKDLIHTMPGSGTINILVKDDATT